MKARVALRHVVCLAQISICKRRFSNTARLSDSLSLCSRSQTGQKMSEGAAIRENTATIMRKLRARRVDETVPLARLAGKVI